MTLSNVHFISGLPRSGSTLLAAILRQNPRFRAAVTSPLAVMCGTLLESMSGASEFGVFFDADRRHTIVRRVFDGYYADAAGDQVVFDTNRSWTGKAALVKELYPQSRIICCVREVGWIIDSVERMLRKNPSQLSRIFNFKLGSSVYGRVATLMNADSGLIGQSWYLLREAWFSEQASQLLVIQYESLVAHPAAVIGRLYHELGEKPFPHDFDHVVYDEPDYDAELGMPGMHTVRAKVEKQSREACIPPDVFAKHADFSFWTRPPMNPRGVLVL